MRRPAGIGRFAAGLVFGVAGAIQLAGAVGGGNDPLAPFARNADAATSHFQSVKSVAELDAALSAHSGKIVMLDFYADWCVSCKEMERFTFTDTRVRSKLDTMMLLRADVTANNDLDKAMLKRFGLFGPPGIIFFDTQGRELANARVIGYQDADEFLRSLAVVAR
jgi:thiol:disulfide interchange protein DsbD